MSESVYVVGTGMIKFGRYPERSVPQLGAEACHLALDDCGLSIQDMEALYSGNLLQASAMVGQRILQEIGQTGIPVVNCANACATGATAFREALDGDPRRHLRRRARRGLGADGQGRAPRRGRRWRGHPQGRSARVGAHACRLR